MDSVKKSWSADVIATLDLVREEVGNATRQTQQTGGAEMSSGNMAPAKKSIGYSDKLDEFMMQVEGVGEKRARVQDALDADLESVKEVVLPKSVRNVKPGFIRNVTEVAPWLNFTARINGGEMIFEPTARAAFVEPPKYFDLDELAKFGYTVNGEQLHLKDKSVFKKYIKVDTKSVLPVKDGWCDNVYTSTATKVRLLSELAKACGVKTELNVVHHASAHGSTKAIAKPLLAPIPKNSRPGLDRSKDGRNVPGVPFKASQVVCVLFPKHFESGLVTAEEVQFLLTKGSSRKFNTRGWLVLKLNRGNAADRFSYYENGKRYSRYYDPKSVPLFLGGKKYYLTSQFAPGALTLVVTWLGEKGVSKEAINKLGEESNVQGK